MADPAEGDPIVGQSDDTGQSEGSILDADGNLSENFSEFLDEDIRHEECLKLLPRDLPGAIKQFVHAQKSFGKGKVVVPTDKSTDLERDQFLEAIGRPKSPDEYEYKWPDALPEDYRDDDRMAKYKKFAHEIGITAKQFAKWAEFENVMLAEAVQTDSDLEVSQAADAEQILKDEWGMGYDEGIHAINMLINKTTEEGDQRNLMIKKFGRDPDFLRWARGVAKGMIEDKALIAEITHATPKEAMSKIDELQKTEGYLTGKLKATNPAKHDRIVRELADLHRIAYPEPVGSEGRR